MRLCVYLLEGKLYKPKSPFFAFLSSRGVIILAEELGGQFRAVLLLLSGFFLTSLLLRWLWLLGFFGFSFGFSWVLHGFSRSNVGKCWSRQPRQNVRKCESLHGLQAV